MSAKAYWEAVRCAVALLPPNGCAPVRPRTTILEQDLESDAALQQALTFIAVSFGIAFIAQIPSLPGGQSAEKAFGILAIDSAVGFGLNVILVVLAWRIVGGKLAGKKILIVACYFSGVSTILFMAVSIVAMGAFKGMDPLLYQQMLSGTVDDPSDVFSSNGYKVFLLLVGTASIAIYVWIHWIWEAYRQLMQLSRQRSRIAFFLFAVFSPKYETRRKSVRGIDHHGIGVDE